MIMNINNLYIFYIIDVGLVVILIIYWAFTLRKKEIIKKISWQDFKEIIRTNKNYYISLFFLVLSILIPILGLMLSRMNIYAVPAPFFWTSVLIGFLAAIFIIVDSLRLFIKSKDIEKQIVPREIYLATLLLGIYWFCYESGLMFSEESGLFVIVISTLGLLVSIRSMLYKGILNKFMGCVLLICFLPLFWAVPFYNLIVDTGKLVGILPNQEKAEIFAKDEIYKAMAECKKYKIDYEEKECVGKVLDIYKTANNIKGQKFTYLCLNYKPGDDIVKQLCKRELDYLYNWTGHEDLVYMYGKQRYPEKAHLLCNQVIILLEGDKKIQDEINNFCLERIEGHIKEMDRVGSSLYKFIQEHPDGTGEPVFTLPR
jgi:hypothetical protein